MGRPSGAPVIANGLTGTRSRERELRQQARPKGERFEEVYSEGEEEGALYGYGNPHWNDLYYHGYDDYFMGSENDSDAALIRTALDRIARARTKGKTNVNLTLDEMGALERRNGLQQHEQSGYLVSPPITPSKLSKSKLNGKSASLTNVVGAKTRQKTSSSPSTPKSNSKAKISRKDSNDGVPVYPTGSPSVLIQGPDGRPMYAPLAYYPPEYAPPDPRSRSRSMSQSSRRDTTPPEQAYGYPMRYFPPPSGIRPGSASSTRSFAEDGDVRRQRSSSTTQHRINDDYLSSPVPAAHGRRNVSGPAEVRYSPLRRAPAASPLVPRSTPQHSYSDPSIPGRWGFERPSSEEDQTIDPDISAGSRVKTSPQKVLESRRRRSRR